MHFAGLNGAAASRTHKLDICYTIGSAVPPLLPPDKARNTALVLVSAFAFLGMTDVGSAPEKLTQVTPAQFLRALTEHQPHTIDFFLAHSPNLNARVGQDRPLLLSAILTGDQRIAERLIEAGASVDLADETGMTPLMAASLLGESDLFQRLLPLAPNPAATDRKGQTALHYAVAAGKSSVVEILLPMVPDLSRVTVDGRSVVAIALEQENPQVVDLVLQHLPSDQEWTADTSRLLEVSLAAGHTDQVKYLLSKHCEPPTAEGRRVPLLAYEIASTNVSACRMLLECGADPNTLLPDKSDPDFLALLPPRLRDYIDGDKEVSVLTLAAGIGQCEIVNALLGAGADRNHATRRFKMLPLYVAAQTGRWQ